MHPAAPQPSPHPTAPVPAAPAPWSGPPPTAPVPAVPVPRPVAATVAVLVLMGLALLAVISSGVQWIAYRHAMDIAEEYRRQWEQEAGRSLSNYSDHGLAPKAIMMVIFTLLVGMVFAGLAAGVWRRSQGARVATFIVGGLVGLLVLARAALNLLMQSVMSAAPSRTQRAGRTSVRADLTPDWHYTFIYLSSVIAVLAIIAVIALLAQRGSAGWFRTRNGPSRQAFPGVRH